MILVKAVQAIENRGLLGVAKWRHKNYVWIIIKFVYRRVRSLCYVMDITSKYELQIQHLNISTHGHRIFFSGVAVDGGIDWYIIMGWSIIDTDAADHL